MRGSTSLVAAGTILECSIPFRDLGVSPGETVAFFVAVYGDRSEEAERHPQDRAIELRMADAQFAARQWRV